MQILINLLGEFNLKSQRGKKRRTTFIRIMAGLWVALLYLLLELEKLTNT